MLQDYVARSSVHGLATWLEASPWEITARAKAIVAEALSGLAGGGYRLDGDVAIHQSAHLEDGAVIKGPAIIGPECFVGAHCLLRGGVWLDEGCSIGPGCEVKATFLFQGARLAHFNFVGDSIIGSDVNFEAGSIVANRRNERAGTVLVRAGGKFIDTGCEKFGALVGDGARIGANAVLAPGTILPKQTIVQRLSLVDQELAGNS